MIKVVVLQRESHVASGVFSLSVAARITEALDFLRDLGHVEYIIVSENESIAENAISWADVLILSKHSSARALDLLLFAKKSNIITIYDIDDWVFSFPAYSAGQGLSAKRKIIDGLIDSSDYITVANAILYSEMMGRRSDTILVPNGMYVEKYANLSSFVDEEYSYSPRVVFTNADLLKVSNGKDFFINALHEFFRGHPDYTMDFYGDPFPEMFSMPYLHFSNRMNYQDYITALIGGKYLFAITPLGGNEDADSLFFNSCKNPFKYLNYGAAHVPGIYSKSPIYEDCITANITGLLVDNTKHGWLDALESMADNASMRRTIGDSAYDDIVKSHHIKYSANKLLKLFS